VLAAADGEMLAQAAASRAESAFEQQVRRSPQALAVVYRAQALSYRELDEQANRLAHCLREAGVAAGAPAGLFLDSPLLRLIGLLAIMKCGATAVSIGIDEPAYRLRAAGADAGLALVLCEQRSAARLQAAQQQALCLDDAIVLARWQAAPSRQPNDGAGSAPAYAVYPAGSKGPPLALAVEHGAVVAAVHALQAQFGLSEQDVVVAASPGHGDAAVAECLWPLSMGARLVLADDAELAEAAGWERLLREHAVTLVQCDAPGVAQLAPLSAASAVGRVLCTGPDLPADAAMSFHARHPLTPLFHLFAPQPSLPRVALRACRDFAAAVPGALGMPLPNSRLLVVDERLEPVPFGVAGELVVGGPVVPRAFLQRAPAQTPFVADPGAGSSGACLYRTGLRVRRLGDGSLARIADDAPLLPAAAPPAVAYHAPRTETEAQLCVLWQEVLKREPVGIDDNFFALGGDSIVSIQLVSRAKQRDLHFSVRQLFEHQTIAQLAPYVNAQGAVVETEQGEVEGALALLPIQRRFFGQAMPVPNHYNQAVLLETPVGFTPAAQRELVAALYARHDALRLRFAAAAPGAQHRPFDAAMLDATLVHHDLSAVDASQRAAQIEAICSTAQASLDIEHGPLFKAVFFDAGVDGGRLLLAIHHLVVDGVSWRILLADLELAWLQHQRGEAIVLAPKTSSLRQWGDAVQGYAQSAALAQERQYWLDQLALPVTPLPRSEAATGDVQNYGFRLDAEETRQLLGDSNKAYRTQVNELLLAALLKAYQHWSGGTTLCLQMEGHGREALFDQLDTNETVGWFTTVYPLLLSAETDADLGTLIKTVKEQYRALPNRGFGYGVLAEIVRDMEIRNAAAPLAAAAIEFNYLGQFDATINRETRFRAAQESVGFSSASANPASVALSINGMVHEGCLGFSLESAAIGQLQSLGHCFREALSACVAHCMQVNERALFQRINQDLIVNDDAKLLSEGIAI